MATARDYYRKPTSGATVRYSGTCSRNGRQKSSEGHDYRAGDRPAVRVRPPAPGLQTAPLVFSIWERQLNAPLPPKQTTLPGLPHAETCCPLWVLGSSEA